MKNYKYNILSGVFILCLIFHFAFKPLNIIKDLPLNGYYEKSSRIELNAENYFSRKYQDSLEKYIKYDFGMFPGFTRINHQMEYGFFGRLHVRDVHKGKNGYLFRYCPGCMSDKKFDPLVLDKYLERYSKFKDSLALVGKSVIWIIAPDKNMIYSEYLSIAPPVGINGYYWDFKKAFSQKRLTLIDFNELAYHEKNKFPFAICNKGGVHWTQAYSARCFDSLCNYLSQTTSIAIKNTVTYKKTGNPWDPDFDIEQAANLLIPLEKENFYSATIRSNSNSKKKKILLIGDSFCHAWMWNKWLKNCFDPKSEFWYYNKEATKIDNTFIKNIDHKNVRSYISKFDSFIFLFSAANMEMLDYNFINDINK